MESNYTVNNLIQLIYGECEIFQRLETEYAIENSEALKLEYYNLKNGFKLLPKVKFSPSSRTIDSILDYAGNQLSPMT